MDIVVPSNDPAVGVMTVSAGETWSFSASGRWTNGWWISGPDGYRNFLADALEIEPRARGQPWLRLMGKIEGEPGSIFPIGAGCTRAFDRAGKLVVFANDTAKGYGNNRGQVRLTADRGGVAAAPGADSGFIGLWREFVDVFSRTAGIPVIAALTLGVSFILVFMEQGRDLVRGIGEDNFLQFPSGLLQIAFAIGLLFLALQAWSWSRIIVTSNYGANRKLWRPRWLLEWAPRLIGVMPFVAVAIALASNAASNTWFVGALIALGIVFFALVIWRQDIRAGLVRRGAGARISEFQRNWVIGSLAGAAVAMVLATIFPVHFGVWLGAPAVVFFGLGFIIPVIVVAIQLGTSSADSGRRRAAHLGGPPRSLGRQPCCRAARLRRRGDGSDRSVDLETGLRALEVGAARRSGREEDNGPGRLPGRRIARRLLDSGGAGATA